MMAKLISRAFMGFLALLLTSNLLACNRKKTLQNETKQDPLVVISAAASLRPVFEAYAQSSPAQEKYSFAGSDILATQIQQGFSPDIYAAANMKLPQTLYQKSLVTKPVAFAKNTLVIAVPTKTAHITRLEDLTKDGVKIAAGSATVPVGSYTRSILGRLPQKQREKILANIVSNEPDVNGIVGKLQAGAVDAGFVYQTDVNAASTKLRAIPLPAALQPQVTYGIAVLQNAKHPLQARAFIHQLRSQQGERLLRRYGFIVP